jgi:hypothetical protein
VARMRAAVVGAELGLRGRCSGRSHRALSLAWCAARPLKPVGLVIVIAGCSSPAPPDFAGGLGGEVVNR